MWYSHLDLVFIACIHFLREGQRVGLLFHHAGTGARQHLPKSTSASEKTSILDVSVICTLIQEPSGMLVATRH